MNYQAIEKALRDKLLELEDRLAHVKKDVSKSHSADFSEQAQERENDEVLDEIGHETSVAIQEIKTALTRIQEGSYGQCANCGEAINPERLQAMPATTSCISCAQN